MLVIARHGQTGLNAQGRLAGRLDVGLTSLGERQAVALAAAVKVIGDPDLVVASPLSRARHTAAALGGDATVDERWIELDYGEFDGRLVSDVPNQVWDTWRSDPEFALPGGESLASLGLRVRESCAELAARARRDLVVVVTHVSPIKAAAAWALGVGDDVAWRMFVAPGSLTCIDVGDRGPSLRSFNEAAHLAGC